MSKIIYVIERVSCRGVVCEYKYKGDKDEILEGLEELKEMRRCDDDDRYAFIREKYGDNEHLRAILDLLSSTSLYCFSEVEEDDVINESIMMVENESGYLEGEENEVGIGNSPKNAILNLVSIDVDTW